MAVAGHVTLLAAQAMAERGRFFVALSGGSVTKILCPTLAGEPVRTAVDWSGWHVFWADERCVPPGNPESNYGLADRLLFGHVAIPRHQIYPLNDTLGPMEAAEAYESVLRRVLPPGGGLLPRFDLILLGIGEDGHTASLFPGSPLLGETEHWAVPVFDSPKPPRERVTLTFPVINNARHVVFVAAGTGKKPVLSRIFRPERHKPELPAEWVGPSRGDLRWFVDEAAAGNLKKTARIGSTR